MDFSCDIFQIYRQYCDIMSDAYAAGVRGYGQDDDSQKVTHSREMLTQLLAAVEAKFCTRFSVLEEVHKLMSRLDLTTDFSVFSRFYDFVFFICRENGQKRITVSRAVMAWRLVLAGRFRLLNQWCDFVEENQRHNISEDTWRQVLAFSRCVHENLEGYDPEGAWPVLIDEFVEHMYRIKGSRGFPNSVCNCGGSESQPHEEILTGLKSFPGSKRKSYDNMQIDQEFPDGSLKSSISCNITSYKRRSIYLAEKSIDWGQNQVNSNKDESFDSVKHNSPISSACAVEGCLSKGFAGLLSRSSCSQFDQDRRVSYTQ